MLEQFLVWIIRRAAWSDWENQVGGKVTEYAGRCSEDEWARFQKDRIALDRQLMARGYN